MLDVDHGGTNIASYTKGDLIAASATTTLNKLNVGTNGQILAANTSTTTGLEWVDNQQGTVTEVTVTAPLTVSTGTTTPVPEHHHRHNQRSWCLATDRRRCFFQYYNCCDSQRRQDRLRPRGTGNTQGRWNVYGPSADRQHRISAI